MDRRILWGGRASSSPSEPAHREMERPRVSYGRGINPLGISADDVRLASRGGNDHRPPISRGTVNVMQERIQGHMGGPHPPPLPPPLPARSPARSGGSRGGVYDTQSDIYSPRRQENTTDQGLEDHSRFRPAESHDWQSHRPAFRHGGDQHYHLDQNPRSHETSDSEMYTDPVNRRGRFRDTSEMQTGFGTEQSAAYPGVTHYATQQDSDDRREQRLARNRASARLRRQRKKTSAQLCELHVCELERAVNLLREHKWGSGSADKLHETMLSAQNASLHYSSSERRQEALEQHSDQYRYSIACLQSHQLVNLALSWSTSLQGHQERAPPPPPQAQDMEGTDPPSPPPPPHEPISYKTQTREKTPSPPCTDEKNRLPTDAYWGPDVYRERKEERPFGWEIALSADLDRVLKLDTEQKAALEDPDEITEAGRQCCELAIITHCMSALRRHMIDAMPFPEINWVHQACWELLNSRQQEHLIEFVKANRASIYTTLVNHQLVTTPVCAPLPPEAFIPPKDSSETTASPDSNIDNEEIFCFADGQTLTTKVLSGQHPHDRARWIRDD